MVSYSRIVSSFQNRSIVIIQMFILIDQSYGYKRNETLRSNDNVYRVCRLVEKIHTNSESVDSSTNVSKYLETKNYWLGLDKR